MPTQHSRVSVTVDPALSEALSHARTLLSKDLRDATLIHDLAVKGAEALGEASERRRRLLRELADPELTARRLDLAALERVRVEDEQPVDL